jgi:hypothetical protein
MPEKSAFDRDRVRIAVKCDHPRALRQHRPCVAAGAERRVHHRLAGKGRERGHDFVEQHRDMRRVGPFAAHSSTPFSAM